MVVVRYRIRRSKDEAAADKQTASGKGSGGQGSKDSGVVKRTERRSRNGCLTCRSRKKKCDERKPLCTSCRRNMLPCRWLDIETAALTSISSHGDILDSEPPDRFLNCTLENWKCEYEVVGDYWFFSLPRKEKIFEYTVILEKDNTLWRLRADEPLKQPLSKFPTHGQLDKKSSFGAGARSGKLLKFHLGSERPTTDTNYLLASMGLPMQNGELFML
ncbi:HGR046Wp [Eremothecium sinecaudum]|uniref:HGR046Wp n=1 Tax=Eremothecium sinecaudum TaxID=45286 RepID=A0A0X8HVX5_9SACH|nr:HGR046Wp [Eremothecium sinecaudum]AMD22385.1 HGR046Wp [Eremothecium sinecaudum]